MEWSVAGGGAGQVKVGRGQPVRREEDRRLLLGGGRYTDDINLPGQAHAHMLRSPLAHARITGLDTAAARGAPGVLAVVTSADLAADGIGEIPCLASQILPLKRADGSAMYVPPRPPLAGDIVRTIGDAIVMVVAETPDQARDACELIEIDYQDLPAVVGLAQAAASEAPSIWPDCPDNVSFVFAAGDQAAVEAGFAAADHVTRLDYAITRLAAAPMEPRAALGHYDRFEERYTLYSGLQNPHHIRRLIAQSVLKIAETRLRVVSPDMGGAFGVRSSVHPELPLVLWASRRVGRPVKWVEDRSEAFLSDEHARDSTWSVELALDKQGTFLALRARTLASMGAYLSLFGPFPAVGNIGGLAGVYRTPAVSIEVTGLFTNTPPVAPYRGAGRPEATYAIERVIDKAAREMGIERIELRRRNMIAPEQMPFQTGLTFTYDCGTFERNMDAALELADYAGFEKRREEAGKRGRLRGIGVANAIEQSAGGFEEYAQLKFDPGGNATLYVGTHNHGQGHETVFKQLLADRLGLDFASIRVVQGDTDLVAFGNGTFGSRSSGLGGAAIGAASDKIIEKCAGIAAHMLEAAVGDIDFNDGEFRITGTDRALAFKEVARAAFVRAALPPGIEPGLMADGVFVPPAPTFPNGCHVVEVEIDRQTGTTAIIRYSVVDDVGTVMNPMLLKGQIHGGIAQGVGQVMMEEVVFEQSSGQLLSGSFLDYCMPRADDLPSLEVRSNPVPTKTNPLGIKGAGEAGCVGALASVMSAILDALAPLGIDELAMPATPERVWRAIKDAEY